MNQDKLFSEMNAENEMRALGDAERKVDAQNKEAMEEHSRGGKTTTAPDARMGQSVSRQPTQRARPSLEEKLGGYSPEVQSMVARLNKYIMDADPRRASGVDFVALQTELVKWCEQATRVKSDKDLMTLMARFMDKIQEHRTGCFSNEMVYRHWREIKLDDKRLIQAANFISMMRAFADPLGRSIAIQRYPIQIHTEIAGKYQERLISYLTRISQ